jgi:hypothetical protein
MQPITVTLSPSGSSHWKLTNWWNDPPQQIGFQVTANGLRGTCQIDVTLQDPSSTYPSSTLSGLRASQIGGPSASLISFVGAITTVPVAAWRATLASSAGSVEVTALQQGVA